MAVEALMDQELAYWGFFKTLYCHANSCMLSVPVSDRCGDESVAKTAILGLFHIRESGWVDVRGRGPLPVDP